MRNLANFVNLFFAQNEKGLFSPGEHCGGSANGALAGSKTQ